MQGHLAISDQGRAAVVARPLAIGGRAMAAPGIPTQELWLRADPVELKTARRFAEAAAMDFGLDEDARFRFTLAVNEAVANAIEHGAPSADGHVQLRISTQNDALYFEVRDWGRFSVRWPEPAEALPERGRGLALMATLVDEVDLRPSDDSTVVRLLVRAA
jgi:anti-sigma regulatory factor (Ser/Thr protein kinase)